MYWPNLFRKSDGRTQTVFGYSFQLTENHLTPDQMDIMKQTYDTLGEKAWEKLDSMAPRPRPPFPCHPFGDKTKPALSFNCTCEKPPAAPAGKRDLYLLLRQNVLHDESLLQLWDEVNTVPSWVSWDQIARGQDCFYRYGGPVLTGLAFQSLLGGMVEIIGPWN